VTVERRGSSNQERVAAALRRVRRACEELTEAEQDLPPAFAGLREIVHGANATLAGMADLVAEQHGLADPLITRWHALEPRVGRAGAGRRAHAGGSDRADRGRAARWTPRTSPAGDEARA
jgi:hypothetical protein